MSDRKLPEPVRLLCLTAALSFPLAAFLLMPREAAAQEVVISDARTTTITTGAADNGNPGDILIDETGAVDVDGGAAVVVNSDNSVTNSGSITSDGETGAIGIHAITNRTDAGSGDEILDPVTGAPEPIDVTGDILNDSALLITVPQPDEGAVAGTGNFGILVSGEGRFIGTIEASENSSIVVQGDQSAGIAIKSEMLGDLDVKGLIDVRGVESNGISIENTLTGNITSNARITALGQGGIGISLGADVNGSLVNSGAITAGTDATFDADGNAIDAVSGKATVMISGNLTGGFLNDRFDTVVDDGDDDPSNDVTVTTTGSLTNVGGGPALLVSPDPVAARDIQIGVFGTGDDAFGIINRGTMATAGTNIGQATTTIRIEGLMVDGVMHSTTLEGGFLNATLGLVSAAATDADAVGISIGAGAIVPLLRSDGNISITTSESQDEDIFPDLEGGPFGGDAFGIVIDEGASVTEIQINGTVTSTAAGPESSAFGIVDRSGTVNRFLNTGSILPTIEDDSSGRRVAVDFSASSQSISFENSGTILGEILLGSGNDTISLTGGLVNGNIDFGTGFNNLFLSGSAEFVGSFTGSNVNLTTSGSSRFAIGTETTLLLDNATFGSGTIFSVLIDAVTGNFGSLVANGTVTFEQGSRIVPQLISILPSSQTFTIVNAGSLILEAGAEIDFSLSSFLFDVDINVTATSIDLILTRKTAQQLGLSTNLGGFFEASLDALSLDAELGGLISNVETLDELEDIFGQLVPVANGATRQLAILTQSASLGAISRRLASLRGILSGEATLGSGNSAFWIQEIGSIFDQGARGDDAGFDGGFLGIAVGVDTRFAGLDAIGFSVVQTFAELEETNSNDETMVASTTQFNLYSALSFGGFFMDVVGGISLNRYESERVIMFDDLVRRSLGDWRGLQYAGNATLGFGLEFGRFSFVPVVSVSYLKLTEKSYTETDGGEGVDLAFERQKNESLVVTAGATLGVSAEMGDGLFQFGIRGNLARELKNDAPGITAGLAAAGALFSVTGPEFDNQYLQFGAGIGFVSTDSALVFDYDMERKGDFTAHIAAFTFRMRF